ncbi:MAG: hypothetical protein ACKVOJ_01365, partial [Sphingomonadaceae bacterium]
PDHMIVASIWVPFFAEPRAMDVQCFTHKPDRTLVFADPLFLLSPPLLCLGLAALAAAADKS